MGCLRAFLYIHTNIDTYWKYFQLLIILASLEIGKIFSALHVHINKLTCYQFKSTLVLYLFDICRANEPTQFYLESLNRVFSYRGREKKSCHISFRVNQRQKYTDRERFNFWLLSPFLFLALNENSPVKKNQ